MRQRKLAYDFKCGVMAVWSPNKINLCLDFAFPKRLENYIRELKMLCRSGNDRSAQPFAYQRKYRVVLLEILDIRGMHACRCQKRGNQVIKILSLIGGVHDQGF